MKIPIYEGLDNMNKTNAYVDLVDFNNKYAKYLECNDSSIKNIDKLDCTASDKDIKTVNVAYNKLMDPNGVFIGSLNTTPIKKGTFDSSYNYIINNFNVNNKVRYELDNKMRDLYRIDNSFYNDNKIKYDVTMYSGILWSVLASSLIYYVFTKL
jgi:hypothetical protein